MITAIASFCVNNKGVNNFPARTTGYPVVIILFNELLDFSLFFPYRIVYSFSLSLSKSAFLYPTAIH